MTMGPDNGESSDSNADGSKRAKDTLSPKAKRIKKEIAEGTYRVDLESLADHLLDEGMLESRSGLLSLPLSDDVQNDQAPLTDLDPSAKDD